MTDPGITDLRALAVAATPGPWFHPELDNDSDWDDERLIVQMRNYSPSDYLPIPNGEADAEFIAAASPDVILALCDRLTEAEAIINDLAASRPEEMCCETVEHFDVGDFDSVDAHGPSCPWRRAVEWKGKQP